jgi:hypothetical protein
MKEVLNTMKHFKYLLMMMTLFIGPIAAYAQDEPTPPTQSLHICDWGLLIIEQPVPDDAPFISIDSPQNYSGVDGNSFIVTGQGEALFENNVVVEVSDASDDVLFTEPTILESETVGGAGEWSLEVALPTVTDVSRVRVRAYSTEPRAGDIIAQDSIDLNLNSSFGLPFIDITRPTANQSYSTSLLLIEGTGGAIFENNISIEVRDNAGDLLAQTFATIDTDELAGRGTWSTTVELSLDVGAAFTVHAFSLSAEDGETIIADDFGFGIANAFETNYERILVVDAGDPITLTDDLCAGTASEFDNTDIIPIMVDSLTAIETRSTMPLINVTINASGSSICPMPQRIRITRDSDNNYSGDFYYAMSEDPVPCTNDLRPFMRQVPLGTQPTPEYSVTINGVTLD